MRMIFSLFYVSLPTKYMTIDKEISKENTAIMEPLNSIFNVFYLVQWIKLNISTVYCKWKKKEQKRNGPRTAYEHTPELLYQIKNENM